MKSYILPSPEGVADVWERLQAETHPLVIWGMGNGADKLLIAFAERGLTAADFVASDGFVRGQSFHGKRVLSFAEVREKYASPALVMAFGTRRPEVLESVLCRMGEYPLYLPDLPVTGETVFDAAYYRAHYQEFLAVSECLADQTSRDLFAAVITYKLTGDPAILFDAWTPAEETAQLLGLSAVKTYIDVGAYTGDTLAELLALGAPLTHAVCVEPDNRNFRKLTARAETLAPLPVTCVHGAAWDVAGTGCFFGSGNRNASLLGASYENRPTDTALIPIDTLTGGLKPDYIKFDTEGAERQGLIGAAATIDRARPKLRVAAYHRTEDLIVLPKLLLSLCPDYHIYLRRKRCLPAWEADLIALPEKGAMTHENV